MLIDHELTDPKRAMQLGVGLVSPLWPTFFIAASAGAAYWAWSQWIRKPALEGFGVGEAGSAPTPIAARKPTPEPELEAAELEPETDISAPPAASEQTPLAAAPANDEPAVAEVAPVLKPAAEALLDETLAVQAAVEPEPAPAPKIAKAPRVAKPPKASKVAAPAPAPVVEAPKPKAARKPATAKVVEAEVAAAPKALKAKPARIAKASGARKAAAGAKSSRASVRRKANRPHA